MPWTCDALLPTAERYASLKFRRFSRRFYAHRLDYADAVELCAFVRTIGVAHAGLIFKWAGTAYKEYSRLDDHMGLDQDVAYAVEANRAAYTRVEGLRVLEVLRENGWTKGPVPEIVRLALLDMRKAGLSQPKIAAALDLTLDQVRVMANGRRRVRPIVPISAAALFAQ